MAIVTLTSDIGPGAIGLSKFRYRFMSMFPDHVLHLVKTDVSTYDIVEGAYVLDAVMDEFPEGSIHLLDIEADAQRFSPFLLAKSGGQYIVAANNGILTLLEREIEEVRRETSYRGGAGTFALLNVYIPMLEDILGGKVDDSSYPLFTEMNERSALKPVFTGSQLRGTVIYVDEFGNAVTNITRKLLEEYSQGRQPVIRLNRHEDNNRIREHYTEVDEGEKVCLWTDSGHLQVAINHGDASRLLGLTKGRMVTIEFR